MAERGEILPLDIPPGINKQGTDYETKGRWRDCDQIRFYQDLIFPRARSVATSWGLIDGACYGAHSWVDNDAFTTLAVGTADNLYVTRNKYAGDYSDITPDGFVGGRDDAIKELGYGVGFYGDELYGTEREDEGGGNIAGVQSWSLNNRGQDLYALAPSDGRVWVWKPPTETEKAEQLENSPDRALAMTVTPQQHIMVAGANGDARQIAWSDNVDPTVWAPDITNQAGFLQLKDDTAPTKLMTYRGNVLCWTESSLFEIRPAPAPFWWTAIKIGWQTGLIAPRAAASNGSLVMWMGAQNFWGYNGSTTTVIPCEVNDYVFHNIFRDQQSKIHAAHIPAYSEFVWYYPANEADVNSYVVFNYNENHWTIGKGNLVAYLTGSGFGDNLSWTRDGHTYLEESSPLTINAATLTSGPIELGDGRNSLRLHYIIPDLDHNGGNGTSAQFKVEGKDGPRQDYRTLIDRPVDFKSDESRVPIRGQARQIRMTLSVSNAHYWELGRTRVSVSPGARRR